MNALWKSVSFITDSDRSWTGDNRDSIASLHLDISANIWVVSH